MQELQELQEFAGVAGVAGVERFYRKLMLAASPFLVGEFFDSNGTPNSDHHPRRTVKWRDNPFCRLAELL